MSREVKCCFCGQVFSSFDVTCPLCDTSKDQDCGNCIRRSGCVNYVEEDENPYCTLCHSGNEAYGRGLCAVCQKWQAQQY